MQDPLSSSSYIHYIIFGSEFHVGIIYEILYALYGKYYTTVAIHTNEPGKACCKRKWHMI